MRYLIYEVSGLSTPVNGQILGFYHCLLGQYLIPDLLSVFADIRSPSQHELISHNPHCKIISRIGMILPADYLR